MSDSFHGWRDQDSQLAGESMFVSGRIQTSKGENVGSFYLNGEMMNLMKMLMVRANAEVNIEVFSFLFLMSCTDTDFVTHKCLSQLSFCHFLFYFESVTLFICHVLLLPVFVFYFPSDLIFFFFFLTHPWLTSCVFSQCVYLLCWLHASAAMSCICFFLLFHYWFLFYIGFHSFFLISEPLPALSCVFPPLWLSPPTLDLLSLFSLPVRLHPLFQSFQHFSWC